MNSDALKLCSALCNGRPEWLAFTSGSGPIAPDGDLIAFLEKNPGARLLPKGADGPCFVFELLPIKDTGWWDDYGAIYPTAIMHNGSRTLAFWALKAPTSADNFSLAWLVKWFCLSLDEPIPLPGQEGWTLHYVHPGSIDSPDQIAEKHLPEERLLFTRGRTTRGLF